MLKIKYKKGLASRHAADGEREKNEKILHWCLSPKLLSKKRVHVHVCMFVCVCKHACMHVLISYLVCVCECVCIHVSVCVVYLRDCMHTFICACLRACVCVCACVRACLCVCVHVTHCVCVCVFASTLNESCQKTHACKKCGLCYC